MPTLRDWMLHHPTDWTPQQTADYVADTRKALLIGITPTVGVVGTTNTCAILMQTVLDLVSAAPQEKVRVIRALVEMIERLESVGETLQ